MSPVEHFCWSILAVSFCVMLSVMMLALAYIIVKEAQCYFSKTAVRMIDVDLARQRGLTLYDHLHTK